MLRAESGDFCKVGRTNNLQTRITTLAIQLPFRVNLHAAYRVCHSEIMERHIHDYFADKRMNGEWFKLSEDDLEFLDRSMNKHVGAERVAP